MASFNESAVGRAGWKVPAGENVPRIPEWTCLFSVYTWMLSFERGPILRLY